MLSARERKEAFVRWLTTQENTNGSLYLERVARQYAYHLSYTPSKLSMSLPAQQRIVYNCETIEEFNDLRAALEAAPNFKEVNRAHGHGSFRAGLSAYERFMAQTMPQQCPKTEPHPPYSTPSAVIAVDFTNPRRYANTKPAACLIQDTTVQAPSWAQMLKEVCEVLLQTSPSAFSRLEVRTHEGSNARRKYMMDEPLPNLHCLQLANGKWINVNFGASFIISHILNLCKACGVAQESIQLTCLPKEQNPVDETSDSLAEVIRMLQAQYPNGMIFNETTMRLISERAGFPIDRDMQTQLMQALFRRGDGVYFVIESIAPKDVLREMDAAARQWLAAHKCFAIGQLYDLYRDSLNESAITNLEDFESLFGFWNKNDLRRMNHYGEKICYVKDCKIQEIFSGVAEQLVSVIYREFGGTASLDDLQQRFPAFSARLIELIAKNNPDELIRIEINDTICYQTLDAMGLTDGFTALLQKTLDQLDEIGLEPSEDHLHTALSLAMGFHFCRQYGIADNRTFRSLITYYYKGAGKRRWRGGKFELLGEGENV